MLKLTSSEIKIKLIFSKIKLEVDFQQTGSLSLLVVVVDCSNRTRKCGEDELSQAKQHDGCKLVDFSPLCRQSSLLPSCHLVRRW